MNSNLANNNEATKRLKQKLQEAEKEMQAKTEEIARSKIKVQTLKAQLNKFEIAEKK